jgi:hypothetical protein
MIANPVSEIVCDFLIFPLLLAVTLDMAEGGKSWFWDILFLPDAGGVPDLPGGGMKATKANCIATFGPATSVGRYMSGSWVRGI